MNLVSNVIKFTDRGEIAINTTKKDNLSLTVLRRKLRVYPA